MQNLDTWLAFFTLAALAYYALPKKIRAGIVEAGRAGVALLGMARHASTSSPDSSTDRPARRPARPARRRSVQKFSARSHAQNAGRAHSAHQNGQTDSVQRSALSVQPLRRWIAQPTWKNCNSWAKRCG